MVLENIAVSGPDVAAARICGFIVRGCGGAITPTLSQSEREREALFCLVPSRYVLVPALCVGMLSPSLCVVGLGPRFSRTSRTLSVRDVRPYAERGNEDPCSLLQGLSATLLGRHHAEEPFTLLGEDLEQVVPGPCRRQVLPFFHESDVADAHLVVELEPGLDHLRWLVGVS
jgi:hypothetical protein